MDPIDIASILRQKAPRLTKRLPSFVINKLRAIIHEDDLNRCLQHFGHMQGLDFVDASIDYLDLTIKVSGEENIPSDDRIIVVSNHPLGGLDGLALLSVIGKRKKHPLFLVNDILMHLPNLQPLFLPVDKYGNNRKYYRLHQRAFTSDATLLHFPAGLCSRKTRGQIQDLEWHKSFITIAQRHQRSILPVYIEGANSNTFYHLANVRERLGISFNVEMILLADEMFKQTNATLPLSIGPLIPYSSLGNDVSAREWAERIRDSVYRLQGVTGQG